MTPGGAQTGDAFPPGQVVAGRYRIERMIGEGGFGAVYQATRQDTAHVVALKILHQGRSTSATQQRRFQREAELAVQLRHPNTVRTLDHGHTEDGLPYIVFELLEGESLQDRVEQRGAMTVAEVGTIAAHVLDALAEAHALGIVHRDIKPANIFLCAGLPLDDGVRVLDFGIAKAIAGDESKATKLTQTGQMLGTPYYMAPEQVRGGGITPATDIYALGLVMAEMLTGRPVVAGTTAIEVLMSHVSDRPLVLAAEVLASPFGPIIFRAIHKTPSERWTSAIDMAAAIRQALVSGAAGQTLDAAPLTGPAGASTPFQGGAAAPTFSHGHAPAAGPVSDGYAPAPGPISGDSYGAPGGYGPAGYHVAGGAGPQPRGRGSAGLYVLLGVLATVVVLGAVGGGVYFAYSGKSRVEADDDDDHDEGARDRDRDREPPRRPPEEPTADRDSLLLPNDQPPKPKEPVQTGSYRVGQKVMVLWGGKWWPATVLRATGNDHYLIHYDGYNSSWDEVVGPSRMRGGG